MSDRVQRPTRHHFVASPQPHYFYYARDADRYMDQCEADIAELVGAWHLYRIATEQAERINELELKLEFCEAAREVLKDKLAKHKGGQND